MSKESVEARLEQAAGLAADHPVLGLWRRSEAINQTEAGSEKAVLTPEDAGAVSFATRAALAARIARTCGSAELAARYQALLPQSGATADDEGIAQGSPVDWIVDLALREAVRHADLVTLNPKAASRTDIETLRATGYADADIVALSELIAFVNYHLRCIHGLRLIAEVGQ